LTEGSAGTVFVVTAFPQTRKWRSCHSFKHPHSKIWGLFKLNLFCDCSGQGGLSH